MAISSRLEAKILRTAVKVKSGVGYHYKNVTAVVLGKVSIARTEIIWCDDWAKKGHYSQLMTDTGFTIWCRANPNLHKLMSSESERRSVVLVQLNTASGEVFYSVMFHDNVLNRNWKQLKLVQHKYT